ncbi:MAG: hypothetical protein OEZ34_06385 [Spirochaetia bacterium]|nr:hypothetical protein [Spirochaetia bacterium]
MTESDSRTGFSQISLILEFIIFSASIAIAASWILGTPLFYSDSGPVISVFTALSLIILVAVRLTGRFLFGWPLPLTLAMLVIVLGGNLTSIIMVSSLPPEFTKAFGLVFTSAATSTGLIVYCVYELFTKLRKTPQNAFIFDDILLHIAVLPVAMGLLGYVFQKPFYTGNSADPRIGTTFLELSLMALFAVNAVFSNRNLFFWRLLSSGWSNRITFFILIVNQFALPFIVGWYFQGVEELKSFGLEVYVMLANGIAVISFLMIQAYLHYSQKENAA